jgi:hypothetical protein
MGEGAADMGRSLMISLVNAFTTSDERTGGDGDTEVADGSS